LSWQLCLLNRGKLHSRCDGVGTTLKPCTLYPQQRTLGRSRVMAALPKADKARDIAGRAVQHRREFLKIGYQACVDQQAIEAARFGPIGAAVK